MPLVQKKKHLFYVNLSRHPHIVRTFGSVYDNNNPDQNNSILLLQEYAPKGSLDEELHDRTTALDEKILIQIWHIITSFMVI